MTGNSVRGTGRLAPIDKQRRHGAISAEAQADHARGPLSAKSRCALGRQKTIREEDEMRKAELVEIEKREEQLIDLLTPFFRCEVPFSYTVEERCMERGLLPGHLLDCLGALHFLSFAVLSAQKAQRRYGVRASVLLSMALDEFGHDIRDLARDPMLCSDAGDVKRISPSIDRWFLARARRLATAKAFRQVHQGPSPRRYIYEICEHGFGDSLKADDLWANIESYHLDGLRPGRDASDRRVCEG